MLCSPGAPASIRARPSACLRRRSLVEDGRGVARAAGLARRAEREQIVFVPGPVARAAVGVWPAPRVFGELLALQIRPVPAGDARRPGRPRLQTLVGRRAGADIHPVYVAPTRASL